MKMTAAELDRYRASLDRTADNARLYVLGRLRDEASDLSVAEARELAIEIVEDATGVYGDQAQAIAAELFDEIMEADGVSARAQVFGDLIDHAKTESKMHYFAAKLVDGDSAGFAADASDLAAYYVHRSAWENLVRNCDLSHVRWARVPTGRETCGWCYMLAARGFDYRSRESADAGKHVGCDCVVVPGNKDSVVAGVDASWLQKCWADCSETVGGPLTREETRALWDALPDEKREEWRRKHGSKAYEAFHDRESVERICAEIERRDAGWLYEGKVPTAIYEKQREELEEHEKAGVDWLCSHGIVPTVKLEDPKAAANIDFEIWGQPWEMKNVTNSGSSVKNQLGRAKKKWPRLGLSEPVRVVVTLFDCTESIDAVCASVLEKGGYREVIVVSKEEMRLIRR